VVAFHAEWLLEFRPSDYCTPFRCHLVFRRPAVLSQGAQARGHFFIIGNDGTTITQCTKVFSGIEAETCNISQLPACRPSLRAPCAWAQSSMSGTPASRTNRNRASISASWPYRWVTITHFVLSSSALARAVDAIVRLASLTST
jgi:hypothetical protein